MAYELKVATVVADWRSTKLSSLILLNSSVFQAKHLSQTHVQQWQQLPFNVKPMGTTITCRALPGNITGQKTCQSNLLSMSLSHGTTFGLVSALSLEKYTCIPTYIQTSEPFFYPWYDSGFSPSALCLHLNYVKCHSIKCSAHVFIQMPVPAMVCIVLCHQASLRQVLLVIFSSMGAESWWGCSDSDPGLLINSGSDSDSYSGPGTKYEINNTLIVERVSAVQAKKETWHFLLTLNFIRSYGSTSFHLSLTLAGLPLPPPPKKELRLLDHLFVQIMFRSCSCGAEHCLDSVLLEPGPQVRKE